MKHTPLHYIRPLTADLSPLSPLNHYTIYSHLRGFFIMKTPRSMNNAHTSGYLKNSGHPKIPDTQKNPDTQRNPDTKSSTSFANTPGDRHTDRNTCACVHVHLIRSAHERAFEFLVLYYYSYYFTDCAFI